MITTTSVEVAGMTCEHCKRAVFTALGAVRGIERAEVSLGRVLVEHDGSATAADITDAIAVAGYSVTRVSDVRRVLPIAGPRLSQLV